MKVRVENSGVHLFDRKNGLHILFDEIPILKDQISKAPRTVSIALTNKCNLSCSYCYAPKNYDTLSIIFLQNIIKKLDTIGTLEITFGGGEPFLYPEIDYLLKWIWNNTTLGINITTNGHCLSYRRIDYIKSFVSSIRFSIDGLETKYRRVKGKCLSNLLNIIKYTKGKIPFGVNVIINQNQTSDLIDVINLSIDIGAMDVLIIPEHQNGRFQLLENDWSLLSDIIKKYKNRIQIYITYEASKNIQSDYLQTETNHEFLFAHISADKKVKSSSYLKDGLYITNPNNIEEYFDQIRN